MLTASLALSPCRAEETRKLAPADESAKDPSLRALLGRMRKLTESRNVEGLCSLMLPTFRVEFDEGKGPSDFVRHWKPDDPGTALWNVLNRALSLGGTFYSRTLFVLPYPFSRFPDELDPLAYVVAIRSNILLVREPHAGAESAGHANYEILPLADPMNTPVQIAPDSYLEIRHPLIEKCFVAGSDVYSPAEHRAFFEKRQGVWHWISLAAATQAEPPDLLRLSKSV